MATKMSEVRAANPNWFSKGNKKFFGDCSYRILHGKITRHPFLVRSTVAWTEMSGSRRLQFRVNPVDPETLKIKSMTNEIFKTIEEVKDWTSIN